ncbi:TerS [Burkholderia phage Bcep22]|uniref:TerS n=1 Tax=Burkholderia phage Bcep22 TaxID=2883944 RepID=Q6V7Q7_9CAUD|nr:terminase small subunit [Burkholderia phage Bcep22]AAQ54969.2 TerS [Burkholderia phage Bcep22]
MSTKQRGTSRERDKASDDRRMTERQKRFVEEFLVDLNGTKAAIRAGFSAKTAQEISSRLLTNPTYAHVQEAIEAAKAARSERTKITQDDVLRHWSELATADVRELVEFRRFACRYCWGIGHAYQWRTEREYTEAVQLAVLKQMPPPGNEGGYGYSKKLAANPDCPECDGDGDGQMVMKDTRNLSGGAALLYAGTQIGKDGLKALTEDRAAARVNVAKHLGMLDPKLTLKGDAENPLQMLLQQVQGSALKPTAQPDDDEE